MRAAGRHTVPPLILKRVRRPARPGFSLADPTNTARHATSLTLQPRQPPPAMRPASPCSPGNCRPPCDQPTLQTRQPPSARHAALLHTGPTAAARRRRSSREADGCFTAPPPLHSQKGQRGQPKGPAAGRGRGGEGRNRKSPQPYPAGLRVAGSAAGRARNWQGSRRGGVQSEGPQPYPAWACGESGGVFSRALYHLQA